MPHSNQNLLTAQVQSVYSTHKLLHNFIIGNSKRRSGREASVKDCSWNSKRFKQHNYGRFKTHSAAGEGGSGNR